MVVSQQEEWTFASVKIGYFLSALSLLSAIFIFYMSCRKRIEATLYFVLIFAALLAAILTQEITPYRLLTNLLYCVCGAYLSTLHSTLVYRQMMYFSLLNILFMIPQILGIEWTQFLTTHGSIYSVPTLFVSETDLWPNAIQQRPAGLCCANILLSLMGLFAIAIHFPRSQKRIVWGTVVMSLMVVLAMAKVLFVGYLIISVYLLVTGNHTQKVGAMFSCIVISFFLWVYSMIFPGLFAANLSEETIAVSIFGRIADILSVVASSNALMVAAENYLKYQPQVEIRSDVALSGITLIIDYLPYLLAAAILIAPVYLKSFFRFKKQYPEVAETTLPILAIVLLYPLAFPIWQAPIYWFMVGFALVPILHRKHWVLNHAINGTPHVFTNAESSSLVRPASV